MEFALTPDQEEFRQQVREFALKELWFAKTHPGLAPGAEVRG